VSSRCITLPLLIVAIAMAGRARAEEAVGHAVVVVVGKDSPIREMTLDTLREVFLRRRRLWPDGGRVMPVNLPADSPYRLAFSERVLGRRPDELRDYWNRLYFDGIRPPLVLKSPAAVCAYLATEPGALAYVPPDAVDEASCRTLLVLPSPDEER
jgi:hypothetical protein